MSDASGGSTTETAAVAPTLEGGTPSNITSIIDTATVAAAPAKPADEAATPTAPAGNRRESINKSSTSSIHLPNAQFNPISRWEEDPVDVIGLTLWDVHSKPRHIQNEDDPNARIRVSVKQLSTEMTCPVCLGFFNKPVTVMECLHRFCAECIEKCLRIGKKECPSCRIHIPSRRSLRNDNNFEELMRSIYGDIETLQRQEAKEIELLNRTQNMNNPAERSRKVGIIQQQKSRSKKRSEIEDSQAADGTVSLVTGASGLTPGSTRNKRLRHDGSSSISAVSSTQAQPPKILGLERSTLVGYYLQRHPQERRVDRLDKELLRTSKDMTIGTVKKFLSAKLRHAPASDFQVLCYVGGKPAALDDAMTVGLVHEQISDLDVGATMVLQYRLPPTT